MEQRGTLSAGQRLLLKNDAVLLQLISGSAEVYGVTRKKGVSDDALSFRRCYLMDIGTGEMAFPSLDEFEEIRVQIYALEDLEYLLLPLEEADVEELRRGMNSWFSHMVELPWLRLIADKGDDMLREWKRGSIFSGRAGREEILAEFCEHEEIFSMLIGMRFGAEDKRLSRRIALREKAKKMLVENGIRSLPGEEHLFGGEGETVTASQQLQEASFVVQRVAKALHMPTDSIGIAEENIGGMDTVALLRRLMQKGNMQMRLVTLPDDWYKKDTGVMLGFYAPPGAREKELAAFIPETPERYRIVLRKRPEGIPLTEEEARRIEKDAFQCYAGFPARALKLWDLIKFMFRQCWMADYRTIIICSLFAGMIPMATPIITETIFQDIIPILDRQGLATVTQALMVTSFTTAALSIVRSIAVMRIGNRIEIAEAAMWGRLMQLPTKFFRKFTVGELASRMGGIGIAKGIASGDFVGSILSFIFSFWSIFLMCYYSLKLTAAAIGVWIVYALFVALVLRRVLFFQRKIIAAGNKTGRAWCSRFLPAWPSSGYRGRRSRPTACGPAPLASIGTGA